MQMGTALVRGKVVLLSAGDSQPLWRGMKHHHACFIPRRGWFEWQHRKKTYRMEPGALALACAGEVYTERCRSQRAVAEVVVFDGDQIETALHELKGRSGRRSSESPVFATKAQRAHGVLALADALRSEADDLTIDSLSAEASVALAGVILRRELPITRYRRAVTRARHYLLERLTEKVRLDDIADHIGMDKYHLARAFRAEFGMALYEYLTHARVYQARRMLREGRPAGDVAASLGYCDQSQLHRHFVRIVGITPGRYASIVAPHRRTASSVPLEVSAGLT